MPKKRKHLFSVTRKDFRVDEFKSGGKGGQHQNTTNSGIRITHIDSGAVGISRDERKQAQNKKLAFNRCINSRTFKTWFKRKCAEEASKKTAHETVEEQLKNVKVEYLKDGKWIEESDADLGS